MDGNFENEKVISVKKIEHLREYNKLKLQEDYLEKNLTSTIKNLKIDADLFGQIDEEKLKTPSEQKHSVQRVLSIVKELKWLKSILQESGIRNLDVRDLGSRLTSLSNKIEDLKKENNDMEVLFKEEESLDNYLREYEKGIYTENHKQQKMYKNKMSQRKCPTRSDVNDELIELISRTGHTQGWSDEDHSLFLKTRIKCESVPQLVIELKKKRPHFTNQDIVNHEAWYKLYAELREKRKKEIADWKLRSRNRNEELISPATQSTEKTEMKSKGVIVVKNDKKKKKNEEEEPNNKKKIIEEWKAERARKLAMDEEQKKRLEEAKIEEERRRREARRFEARIKLDKYKEKRTKTFGFTLQTTRVRNKQADLDSLRLIKSFREQDERFVRKRLSRLKISKKVDEKDYEKRELSRFREYSTLFKPTKGWKEKCKRADIDPDDLFRKVNYVKDIQRLSKFCVPDVNAGTNNQ